MFQRLKPKCDEPLSKIAFSFNVRRYIEERGIKIPTEKWVQLQFLPQNGYMRSQLNFTGKLNIHRGIQTRQVRMSHPDAHYQNAQLKYLKEMVILMGARHVTLVSLAGGLLRTSTRMTLNLLLLLLQASV